MTTERERPLQELYDLTPQIPEPEITPVLKGTYRIRGPMDGTHNHLPVNLVDSKERSPKHVIEENFCTRTVPGTCNVCSAPCSSCMHNSKAESVMESKVEDDFQEGNLRKEADNFSTINSQVTASYKSRVCDDGEHVASEGSNFFGEASSPDSFSENADSKTAVRIPDTRDVSKNVNMPTKVLPDKSIFEDELQPTASNAENINAQGALLSKKIADSLPQKTSFQDVEKHTLGSQGDNISCISRSSGVNIAGHPDMNLGRKVMVHGSILTSDLPSKDPKNLKIQTAYGANAEFETNSRSSDDYANESPKYFYFSSANGVSPGNPDPSHFSSQIKDPSPSDTNPKEGENPCIQPPAPGGPSETSLKHESSRLAGGPSETSLKHESSRLAAADDTSPIIGSCDVSLEFGERKNSLPPVSELSPHNAIVSHRNVRDGISLDDGNSSDQLIESDTMKQENQNAVTESKLCEPSLAKSDSSAGTLKGNQKSVRSGSDVVHEDSSDQQRKSDMLKEENGNPSIEPDFLEDDVKVCDICGDAGREDLLAICGKCSDGAEHTYCMRLMLDKVPEGDWLCEECKIKEDAESKKVVKPEEASGMLREPSFNKSRQDFGNTNNVDSKNQPKLDNKTTAATQPVKGTQYLRSTSKIHVDNIDITTPSNRKTSEVKSPIAMSSGMGSPCTLKKLSRESSSKSLDAVKVRRSDNSLLSANSSQVQNHAPTSSEHNSSNIQSRYHSARGSSSKSSFDNVKAKVKHIPQKTKSFNEPTRNDIKKGVNHMMCKSASFKSMGRTRSSIDSTCKPQHISQTESLTLGKERSNMDRRNSFKTDRPHSSSSLLSVSSISSKRDIKAASHDGKLSDPSETSIGFANKGLEDKNCSVVFDEKKQQAPYSEKSCPPKEEFTSENQKPIRGSPSANTVTDKSCDSVVQSGLVQSWPSAGRDVKNKPVSLSNSRQAVPSGDKHSKCQTFKETGHATQFCSFDKIRVTALKPSGERNQVDKTNKWKYAADKAVSKAKLHANNRLSDQPNRLPMSSTSLTKKVSTKDQLDISIECKNFAPSEETTDVEESSRSLTNNSNKTTFQNDVKQKAPLPVEPAHAFKIGDSIVHYDASKCKPLSEVLPEKTSIYTPLTRALAFPETCDIWKGSFEVYRSEKLCILYDGVQAHLCNCASPKVLEVVTSFPSKVQLDETTCVNSWPSRFHQRPPTVEDIALFFFATDLDSYEKHYKKLVDDMIKNDLVLKGSVKEAELLIFPSNKLPERVRCWNGFNYLWGALRAMKSDFPVQVPDREKKSCQFSSDAEFVGQDFPPCSADVSVLEKENSCRPVIEEAFTCQMQAKVEEDQKPNTSMNAETTTCGSKNWSFDLNENSQDDEPLEEVAFGNSFPSKEQHTCTSLESTSVSVTGETSVLGSCCNLVEVGGIQHPWKEKKEQANVEKIAGCRENTTFLPGLLTGRGKGVDTLPAPAAVPQTKLRVKRTVSEEKTKATEILIDLEVVPECLQPESIVHEEHVTSGPMHNVKRTRSYSPESVSQASAELARESMLSGQNNESKKLKLRHGEHVSDDGFAEQLGSERCFFPIRSGSLAEAMPAEVIPSSIISSGNEGGSHMDIPNLELVLGSERERRSQKMLPLLFSLPETRHARPPDTVLHLNDDTASPCLSLAVPPSENGPLSRRTEEVEDASTMERHRSDRPNLNNSFLLFGGVIDVGKE